MNTPTTQKTALHPVLWVAAVAVILFSLVGIAAITGYLPGAKSSAPETPAPVAAVEPPPALPEAAPSAPAPEPVAEHKAPAKKPTTVATKPKQVETYSSKPQPKEDTVTYKPAPPPPCPDCGTVSAITPITQQGEGTGLGAIAGGILGGVIGNQIGGGSGKDVARIAGIAGGAYAGHQVEKSQRTHTAYEITVRYDNDGTTQRFQENAQPIWQVGDKVRVENGRIVPR